MIEKYIPDIVGTKMWNLKTLAIKGKDAKNNLLICTNDVSVRTNRTELIQNQSENKSGWFFCCLKTILKSSKRKDGVRKWR